MVPATKQASNKKGVGNCCSKTVPAGPAEMCEMLFPPLAPNTLQQNSYRDVRFRPVHYYLLKAKGSHLESYLRPMDAG